jgi:hypothetical protein
MRSSAKKRVESQMFEHGYLPMHSPEAIEKRAKKQTKRYIDKVENSCNISIVQSNRQDCGINIYTVKCNNCQYVYTKWHSEFLECPKCNKKSKSLLEEKLEADLIASGITNFVRNSRSVLDNRYELDFFFPEKNFAIEIHGLYYHSELKGRSPTFHLEKLQYCEQKNIELVQIFEDEFLNNYDVILHKILYKLGVSKSSKLNARDCEVKKISSKESTSFLKKYHLQGSAPASIHLGLYYQNTLVSVMTFGKPNASKGQKHSDVPYELVRYACSTDFVVRGGASKLLKYFIDMKLCSKILSYADLRWVNRSKNLYTSLGFKLIHASKPNYWYFKRPEVRYHRFNFTKQKTVKIGGDPSKTEWQNMQDLGWNRIWDCGNLRYELIL